MARGRRAKTEPKPPKGLEKEWKSEVDADTTDRLKARIVEIEKQKSEVEEYVAVTPAIIDAKAELETLMGPVKENRTILKNRTKYIIKMLKDRGAL